MKGIRRGLVAGILAFACLGLIGAVAAAQTEAKEEVAFYDGFENGPSDWFFWSNVQQGREGGVTEEVAKVGKFAGRGSSSLEVSDPEVGFAFVKKVAVPEKNTVIDGWVYLKGGDNVTWRSINVEVYSGGNFYSTVVLVDDLPVDQWIHVQFRVTDLNADLAGKPIDQFGIKGVAAPGTGRATMYIDEVRLINMPE